MSANTKINTPDELKDLADLAPDYGIIMSVYGAEEDYDECAKQEGKPPPLEGDAEKS